jgi:hypothetical protein
MTEEEIERFALPLREAERVRQRILEEGAAYLAGWEEGLFAPLEHTALHSKAIALYEGMDRLAFWRGHREGRSTRETHIPSTTTPAKPSHGRPWPTTAIEDRV